MSLSAVPHTLLYFARSQRADSDYDPCCCCCGNVSDENCLFSTISSKLFSIVVVPPPPPTPSPAHHAPQLLHFSAKSAKKFPLVFLFYHVRDVGEHLHETGLLLPRLKLSELSFFYKGKIKDSNQFYKVWLLKRLSLNSTKSFFISNGTFRCYCRLGVYFIKGLYLFNTLFNLNTYNWDKTIQYMCHHYDYPTWLSIYYLSSIIMFCFSSVINLSGSVRPVWQILGAADDAIIKYYSKIFRIKNSC